MPAPSAADLAFSYASSNSDKLHKLHRRIAALERAVEYLRNGMTDEALDVLRDDS